MKQPANVTSIHTTNMVDNVRPVKRLATDSTLYLIRSVFVLLFGVARATLIPIFLTVEDFGLWRLIVLYSAYGGILHLGFADGAYLHWLGKDTKSIHGLIKSNILGITIVQFLTTLIIIPVLWLAAILPSASFAIALLIFIVINNYIALMSFGLETLKKFGSISLIVAFVSLAQLLIVILLGLADKLEFWTLLLGTTFIMSVKLGIMYNKTNADNSTMSLQNIVKLSKSHIRLGIWVLTVGLIMLLSATADRFLVSLNFSISEFAIYSLAAAIIDVIFLFLRNIRSLVTPYIVALSAHYYNLALHFLKGLVLISWGLCIGLFFPVEFLVVNYLPQFKASLPILAVMLPLVVFNMVIILVHDVYFKSKKRVVTYAKLGIVGSIISVFCIWLIIEWSDSLTFIVVAQAVGAFVWYLANELKISGTSKKGFFVIFRDLTGIALIGAWFMFCLNIQNNSLVQLCFFYLGALIVIFAFWLPYIKSAWSSLQIVKGRWHE